jgi:hypothetical protein
VFKSFTCFVCFFFLIFMGGFSSLSAESRARTLPMGEMISWGNVKIQVGENILKNAESSASPVFPGMTIKTEKGAAAISLGDQNQIDVGYNSILILERHDQIRLAKGKLDFRIAPHKALSLSAGNFIVVGTPTLQAGKNLTSFPKGEEAQGSLTIHSNGAVTIQANQGQLMLLNKERTVLAAVSPKESITVPAAVAEKSFKGEKSPIKIAQVGEEEPAGAPEKAPKSEGWSTTTWVAIGVGGALVIGGIAALAGGGGGGGGGGSSSSPPPACP